MFNAQCDDLAGTLHPTRKVTRPGTQLVEARTNNEPEEKDADIAFGLSFAVHVRRGLTFDMSGGPKGAKRPLERPLDGGVGRLPHEAARLETSIAQTGATPEFLRIQLDFEEQAQ